MKCDKICEWNGYGQVAHCFKPQGAYCWMEQTCGTSTSTAGQEAKADSYTRDKYERWAKEKSCLTCATSYDGGIHCDYGIRCKRGKYWTQMPYEDFLKYERRREANALKWEADASSREGAQEAKADAGKLQLHLVPMQIVRDICEVREYGNKKYGDPENWRNVELMRYVDALLRHTLAFAEDIHSVDEESGIPHYKHMECNLAFISEMMRSDADGRVRKKAAASAGE